VSDEYLRIFKTLWTQSPASFAGEFYRFEGIRCLPQPVQKPHPPIWIGGHSKVALRRAARYGDGWHPVGANPAVPLRIPELTASLDELRRLTDAEQRDFSKLAISYKAPVYDASQPLDSGGERRPFTGGLAQIAEDVAEFARAGVSEIMERMERFSPVIGATADL
jgi:alkanesulfonate monooxygenase SsuD/methylene tetrahydromethanopterin reductase-like flavin-dependent oxidoreductase (luciferase family)